MSNKNQFLFKSKLCKLCRVVPKSWKEFRWKGEHWFTCHFSHMWIGISDVHCEKKLISFNYFWMIRNFDVISGLFRNLPGPHLPGRWSLRHQLGHGHVLPVPQVHRGRPRRAEGLRLLPRRGLFPREEHSEEGVQAKGHFPARVAEPRAQRHSLFPGPDTEVIINNF